MVFPRVLVLPRVDVKTSSIPAYCKTFLGAREDTIPVPRGAGTSLNRTDPHFPVTFVGTVWGSPILFPQYPLRTGTTVSLARMMAPRIAVATSLAHLTPRPMCPSLSPTTTNALNLVLCPARVCFWTGMIFITSSLSFPWRKKSTIWCSLMGNAKR